MLNIPELPLTARHIYSTHDTQCSDNTKLLINLVLKSEHQDDLKYDMIETLSHLVISNCPKAEQPSWIQFRKDLLKGYYSESESKDSQFGKGYFGYFEDSYFFINRIKPLPSPTVIAVLRNLRANLNITGDKKLGVKMWRLKMTQVGLKQQFVYNQIMQAIDQE